ncbi:MAG: type VI secretion system baseplate subunit TssE [Sulfuricurvum sp.]|nr:type VI secretion system baseplate subunit TssE [Sulfuricurvum sp.]
MAYKGSLFERLSASSKPIHATNDEEAMYQSIANNLSRIFSTNAGSAETVNDYGRPDLNNIHMSQKDSIEMIEKSAEICIRKYEPRLINARVGISREQLYVNEMNVHIEGFLILNRINKKVTFKANLLGNGAVKVLRDDN